MFGSLGVPEILLIMGLALLIFGPKRLPQVGRTLGRTMAEFRKASNDLRRTLNAEMIEQELRENDPRRIVRDSLRDVKNGLSEAMDPQDTGRSTQDAASPTGESGAPSGEAAAKADEVIAPAAEPVGAVARGSSDPVPETDSSSETGEQPTTEAKVASEAGSPS